MVGIDSVVGGSSVVVDTSGVVGSSVVVDTSGVVGSSVVVDTSASVVVVGSASVVVVVFMVVDSTPRAELWFSRLMQPSLSESTESKISSRFKVISGEPKFM